MLICFLLGCAPSVTSPFISALGDRDSVNIIAVNSPNSAKVAIFHCTVETTLWGKAPPDKIALSFLHYPGCSRLSVGKRYLCAVRHDSGTEYTLIRSDMLEGGNTTNMSNCAWEADTAKAKEIEKEIERYNDASQVAIRKFAEPER